MSVDSANSVLGRVRLSTRSDEQLLARARHGDPRCFDELHRRYRSSVFGYCLMRLADRQAAEDATQEVFLKVSQAPGAAIENAKAWLFTIARNVVIDAARRTRSAPVFTELEGILDSAAHSEDAAGFTGLDVTANVYIALRRLPTRERQAFIHREFHDWTSQRIAEELETKPSNVDVLVCRARAAFGRAYAEVADLPFACRQATETIYRELGSGASDHGRQLMKAHLTVCPRCHAEHQRAHSPRFVSGLIPWLWLGVGTRALAQVGERLKTSVVTAGARVNQAVLPGWSGPAKAAVAVVIAVTATAVAPSVTRYVTIRPPFRSASAITPRSPVSSSSLAWNTGGSARRSIDGGTHGGDAAHDMEALHAAHTSMVAGHDATVSEHDAMVSGHDATNSGGAGAHDTHSSGSGSTATEHSGDGTGTDAVRTTDPAGVTHTGSGGTTEHATEPHTSDGGEPAP